MTRILCFGDSITFGHSDPDGGWPQRLSRYLENIYINKYGNRMHAVYNLGVDGDTSAGLLKRIESEAKARANDGSIIVIAIGTNDSIYRENGEDEIDIEEYEQNLQKLIKIADGITKKIIVVGLLGCDEKKMQPMPWSKSGKCYSNARIKRFNKAAKTVALNNSVIFEDMFDDFSKFDTDLYLHDGIHPNSVGHQYIADRIKKKVAELANDYRES